MNYKLKSDNFSNAIDQTRFFSTDERHSTLGNPTNFVQENFLDQSNTTKDIPLLPLFSNYMTNNFGFYTLEFEYHSICGEFLERMYVEYGATYVPTFNFAEALTGGGYAMNQVPTNTSFSNPYVSCKSSSILNLTNVSSNIYSNNPLNIVVERFDNTTGNSDGIIVDITFDDWNAASNVNLRNYAWGDPATQTPANSYASYYNNWSGWTPFILGLLDPIPYLGLTLNYYDNQDDIYNVRIEYTTTCGTETSEMWFTPTSATCKTGINNFEDIKITSSIYPNPTVNAINVSYFTLDANSTINIYNVTGQKVFERKYTSKLFKVDEKINLEFLNNGIYYLDFESVNGKEVHKIIKQ